MQINQRKSSGKIVFEKLSKNHMQSKIMNNYLSIGCDALVTLNFHKDRKNMWFPNRVLNKVNLIFIFLSIIRLRTFI